jgi:hypothetical protein
LSCFVAPHPPTPLPASFSSPSTTHMEMDRFR